MGPPFAQSEPDCLAQLGVTSNTLDAIAEGATGGAVRLVVEGKDVMVVFGADENEAKGFSRRTRPSATRSGNATL